jgi:signal peptidase II
MKRSIIAIVFLVVVQFLHWWLYRHYGYLIDINARAVWGIAAQNTTIIIISLLALGALIYLGATIKPRWPLALLLILASATSNLIDRIYYGGVIDYFDIKIWPVFNIPDIIIAGATIWYSLIIFKARNSHHNVPLEQ